MSLFSKSRPNPGPWLAIILTFSFPKFSISENVYYFKNPSGSLCFSDEPPSNPSQKAQPIPISNSYVIPLTYKNGPGLTLSKRSKQTLRSLISRIAEENNIEAALVEAVVKAESEYNSNAISKKGALGLMQLMPATAESLGVFNPHDPEENLKGGIVHLKRLLNKYNGNFDLAIAAYNAGEDAIRKYQGIPPYPETIDYLAKVRKYYSQLATTPAYDEPFSEPTTLSP